MIAEAIKAVRTMKCAVELAPRVLELEKKFDAAAKAIDVLDQRDDDLRARQDEFAKV